MLIEPFWKKYLGNFQHLEKCVVCLLRVRFRMRYIEAFFPRQWMTIMSDRNDAPVPGYYWTDRDTVRFYNFSDVSAKIKRALSRAIQTASLTNQAAEDNKNFLSFSVADGAILVEVRFEYQSAKGDMDFVGRVDWFAKTATETLLYTSSYFDGGNICSSDDFTDENMICSISDEYLGGILYQEYIRPVISKYYLKGTR